MKTLQLMLPIAALALAACTSVQSTRSPSTTEADGIVYYMPKKDFLITITMDKDNKEVQTITAAPSTAYPDLENNYVLKAGTNVFGKTSLEVGVTQSGLITSSDSKTTSQISLALTNLAESAAYTTLGRDRILVEPGKEPEKQKCVGEQVVRFVEPGSKRICNADIKIELIGMLPSNPVQNQGQSQAKSTETRSGLYYRQALPYLVTATITDANRIVSTRAAIVFSPTGSPIQFLPTSRTFFADNATKYEFTDGMLTKFKEEKDGEAVALFKIPADVLAAYAKAIGQVFTEFGSNADKETSALNKSTTLELARKKADACLSAIKANDENQIKALGCQ